MTSSVEVTATYRDTSKRIFVAIEDFGQGADGTYTTDYTSAGLSISDAEDLVADLLTAIADAKSKVGA